MIPEECQQNICGHVDSEVRGDLDTHRYMTPYDFDAILDVIQHVWGHRTGPDNCYVCHCNQEEEQNS